MARSLLGERAMRWPVVIVGVAFAMTAGTAPTWAQPRPTLDDFFERTRERDQGFDACVGYCDGHFLATLLVGAETANPSTDADRPAPATGARLGGELGVRKGVDVARTRLWADVLRVNGDGQWLTDVAWQVTAFKAIGHRDPDEDDEGWQLALDNVVAQHSELRPVDVARLQQVPYRSVDSEAEIAPIGPKVDKDGHLAIPVGVANRITWPIDGGPLERKTSVSAAIAIRGFPKDDVHHAQFDVLRLKRTAWDVPGGTATAWTISAGYQRLPVGIDTLPLWALIGYEWAGGRSGVTAQIGMDLPLATAHGTFEIAPRFERHLEVDPMTATAMRVTAGGIAVRHELGPVRWGVGYEAVAVEGGARIHAITPELGVAFYGLELGLSYRFTFARRDPATPVDPMTTAVPRDRFEVAVDHRF